MHQKSTLLSCTAQHYTCRHTLHKYGYHNIFWFGYTWAPHNIAQHKVAQHSKQQHVIASRLVIRQLNAPWLCLMDMPHVMTVKRLPGRWSWDSNGQHHSIDCQSHVTTHSLGRLHWGPLSICQHPHTQLLAASCRHMVHTICSHTSRVGGPMKPRKGLEGVLTQPCCAVGVNWQY